MRLIYKIFIFFVFFTAFFDPQNSLGLRYPLIFIMLYFYIINFQKILRFNLKNKLESLKLVLMYILPFWGLLIYIFRGHINTDFSDTSYISFSIIVSMSYLLEKKQQIDDFKKITIISGILFSITSLTIGFFYLYSPVNINQFFIENNIARIDMRNYGSIELPYIYMYSSTLLLLPISLLIEKKYTNEQFRFLNISFYIMLIALFISGTRSHLIISLVFLSMYLKKYKYYFYVIIFIFIIYNFQSIYDFLLNVFSLTESNNSYKFNMLNVYKDIFNDPVTFFLGDGYEAIDWNYNLKKITAPGATKSELTFLEFIRVYGIIITSIITFLIAILIFEKPFKLNRSKRIVLLLLLFDSLFNPHLFSTYGALICAYALSEEQR